LVFYGAYKIIQWLADRYEKAELDKSELAKDVIKLTLSIESKMDNDKMSNDEIKNLLIDIRDRINKRYD